MTTPARAPSQTGWPPLAVRQALSQGKEALAVQLAIRAGERNENQLANLIFFHRHPERNGALLRQGEPNYAGLSREWLQIRDTLVRPALAGSAGAPDQVIPTAPAQLLCPMCWRSFPLVSPRTGKPVSTCPNDGFPLSTIGDALKSNPGSFVSLPAQSPHITPFGLICRGSRKLTTAQGVVTVYWDESRFVDPHGGNYTLWGSPPGGPPRRVEVIGRATWGAAPPLITGGRLWEFHTTELGKSPPYRTLSIPSNDSTPLAKVLKWMTVHHTKDPAQSSYVTVRSLQCKHQHKGGGTGGPYADIGYHFVIDADGKIYEGRPLGIKGSHVELFNGGNIGIVLAGEFHPSWTPPRPADIPTSAALNSLYRLVEVLALRFGIRSVWTHQARKKQSMPEGKPTECPGETLIPHVNAVLRVRYPGPPA